MLAKHFLLDKGQVLMYHFYLTERNHISETFSWQVAVYHFPSIESTSCVTFSLQVVVYHFPSTESDCHFLCNKGQVAVYPQKVERRMVTIELCEIK